MDSRSVERNQCGALTIGPMPDSPRFFLLPFRHNVDGLRPSELIDCGADEERCFRVGRGMAHRVAGIAFFRIETAASGDQWTEVEVLCTHGDVPQEVA